MTSLSVQALYSRLYVWQGTKGTKHQEYSNKRGGDRRTNKFFLYIYNEGTIIVNTNCKKHVVLLTNNVMERANKYIKKKIRMARQCSHFERP